MVDLQNLLTFLKQIHVSEGEYNFVSLRGGKYQVSREASKKFLELYCKAAPFFTEDNAPSLAWKTPNTDYLPLIFDVDLHIAEDVTFSNETFIELAKIIMYHVSCEIKDTGMGIVLTRKQHCYRKKTDKGFVFKTGIHMFVFGVLVSKPLALHIRDIILAGPFLPLFLEKHNILNPANDVLDKSVCPCGKNGLLMLADYKGQKNTGKSYSIFFRATYNYSTDGWNHPKEYLPEQTAALLSDLRYVLWGWLWTPPKWKTFGEGIQMIDAPKNLIPPPGGAENETDSTQSEFNLEHFLGALKGWIPKHSDKSYQQIVYFCRSQGLDPAFVGQTCNAAWNYTDDETENMMRNAMRPDSGEVGKASMIRLLQLHATQEWDERDIFGKQYFYHNEAKMFDEPGRVWGRKEIEDFVSDVYSYCWGDGRTQFIYKEQRTKRFGEKHYTATNIVISDSLPFSDAKSDKLILMNGSLKDLKKEVRRLAKQKVPNLSPAQTKKLFPRRDGAIELLKRLKKIPRGEQYQVLETFLGDDMPEAEEEHLGGLVAKTKQRGKISNSYHSYTIIPYLERCLKCPTELGPFPGRE